MNYKLKASTMCFTVVATLFISQAFADVKLESDLGITASYYHYEEPSLMQANATNIGMNYIGTLVFQNDWLLRGDAAGVLSTHTHYNSNRSGSQDIRTNWYTDIRALFGKNFGFESFMLTPYTGFGYRYLYYNSQGLTSTGSAGYRRESNYYYLPVGLAYKLDLADQSKLVTNIEFDYLLIGRQISYLSDIHPLYPDITNIQHSGYGARLSFMYQIKNWSLGPYVNYWRIQDSDIVVSNIGGKRGYSMEPKNYTVEAGFKISLLF